MTIYAFTEERREGTMPKSFIAFNSAGFLWWLRKRDGGYYFDAPVVPSVAASFPMWLEAGAIEVVVDYPTVDEGL